MKFRIRPLRIEAPAARLQRGGRLRQVDERREPRAARELPAGVGLDQRSSEIGP